MVPFLFRVPIWAVDDDADADVSVGVHRYLNIFYSTWGLLIAGLVFAVPMMHMRITDHTTEDDDGYYNDDGASSIPPRRSDAWDDRAAA